MLASGHTGRQRHNVLIMSVHPYVHLLPNLLTQYFENVSVNVNNRFI